MDLYAQYSALKIASHQRVLTITLDNPPGNAFTAQAHGELAHVFRAAARDSQIGAVVLTGAGGFSFSVGGDIAGMVSGLDNPVRLAVSMAEAREIVLSILECDKPVVARINGHAVGLGASLALCCDITVMVETAKIGDPHVKLGLVAGDGGALLWPHLVGLMRARRYLLTGDMLTGREAADIGLITSAVAADDLDATVAGWAGRLASAPSAAIGLTKRALNTELRQQAQVFMDTHLGLQTLSYLSIDHREAVMAAAAKQAR